MTKAKKLTAREKRIAVAACDYAFDCAIKGSQVGTQLVYSISYGALYEQCAKAATKEGKV